VADHLRRQKKITILVHTITPQFALRSLADKPVHYHFNTCPRRTAIPTLWIFHW